METPNRVVVQLALERGLLDPTDLAQAQRAQQERTARGESVELLALLLQEGYLSATDWEELKVLYERNSRVKTRASGDQSLPSTLGSEAPPLPGKHTDPEAVPQRASLTAALRAALVGDPLFSPMSELSLVDQGLLGAGGMGEVRRVRDRRLGREAALKVLSRHYPSSATRSRFWREALITSRLDHPSIPPVYDAGIDSQGLPFMLMKLIEGDPLSSVLKQRDYSRPCKGRSELLDLLEVVVKVGEALAYAHTQGIVHRDVKPANVIVGRFGQVMLLDWGLAKSLRPHGDIDPPGGGVERRALTETGAVMGTPGYMAPEQVADSSALDERADVFALGAVLTAVLTGSPPVSGPLAGVLQATLDGRLARPRDLRAGIPAELDAIATRALAVDPKARPSAMGFVLDLRAYVASEPVPGYRYGVLERITRFARHHALLLLLLVAALLGVTGTGAAWAFAAQQRLVAMAQAAKADRAEQALAEAKAVRAKRAEVILELQALEREADSLWPPSMDQAPRFEIWLARAEGIARELEDYRQARAELREHALLRGEEDSTVGWEFATRSLEWDHELIVALVVGLDRLVHSAPGAWQNSMVGITERLRLAREGKRISLEAERSAWEEVIASVASLPVYHGLRLEPVEGLVPIGRDPESGLWEFWHVLSGERPERGAGMRLEISGQTGMVLVLVPGGSFHMGSRKASDERPVRRVRLEAFFVSKFEMTQSQWERATGEVPSNDQDPALPVEMVSWEDCQQALPRLSLGLPSEAQWEYAARATSTTPWWTGDGIKSLQGAANLADRHESEEPRPQLFDYCLEIDDGQTGVGPVGSYRANRFGLHDVAGNVWEWCLDNHADGYPPEAPVDGSAWEDEDFHRRVMRGGSWACPPEMCRSAYRFHEPPFYVDDDLGVRPVRTLR